MLQADSFYSPMQSAQPDSQVETHLVDLLDFDKFALIKMLVQNRLKVVWCMRLNRAQSDEEHTRIQVRISCMIWLLHRLSLYAIFAHNKPWNHAACQVHDRVVSGTPFHLCCPVVVSYVCTMFAQAGELPVNLSTRGCATHQFNTCRPLQLRKAKLPAVQLCGVLYQAIRFGLATLVRRQVQLLHIKGGCMGCG